MSQGLEREGGLKVRSERRRFAACHRQIEAPREGGEVLSVVRVWALVLLEQHVEADDLLRPELAEGIHVETRREEAHCSANRPAPAMNQATRNNKYYFDVSVNLGIRACSTPVHRN